MHSALGLYPKPSITTFLPPTALTLTMGFHDRWFVLPFVFLELLIASLLQFFGFTGTHSHTLPQLLVKCLRKWSTLIYAPSVFCCFVLFCPETGSHTALADSELLSFLPPSPECWAYSQEVPCFALPALLLPGLSQSAAGSPTAIILELAQFFPLFSQYPRSF